MPPALRRKLVILLLGFSSGLPLALTGGTLQAWLKDSNVSLETIGFLSLITVPYTYKFLWAPVLDSTSFFGLGRRRGWMLFTQVALIAALVFMSVLTPAGDLKLFAMTALCVALVSATQDIAIDAYRREILPDEELGMGAALSQLGYRLGMILSSGVALILADHFTWDIVYQIMAMSIFIGVATTLLCKEPEIERKQILTLKDYFAPFKEFFTRQRWFELMLLILLYKITDAFAFALSTAFLLETGFSKTEIGSVMKIIGVAATIGGSLIAGALMEKITLKKALIVFGIIQLSVNLAFAQLSIVGHNLRVFVQAVILENFGSGLGTAAYVAFLMKITERRFSAAQYALFTGLAAFSRIAVQAPSGYAARYLGWTNYFLLSAALGIPAVLLIAMRYDKWRLEEPK